jgi:hypothetical protein
MARQTRKYSQKLPKRQQPASRQRKVIRVGRNEPCPCGSGQKYKDCHESEGQAFLHKLEMKAEQERRKERRRELKDAGVPWYRRVFIG